MRGKGIMLKKHKNALIIVDLQKDFCEGGSLAVPLADAIVPLANQLQPFFDCVIATQDWHPSDHISFASNHPGQLVGDVIQIDSLFQVMWPDHCVQDSKGAEFNALLDRSHIDYVIHKGTNSAVDSYSAFFDNAHLYATGLAEYLNNQNITDIYIMGLATDYCVKYSCLDAVHLGFKVHVILDACRGVELMPGDIASAIKEMQDIGVELVTASDVMAFLSSQ